MPSDDLPLPLQIAGGSLFIASLAVWAFVIRRSRSGKEIVRYEPRRPVPWQGVDLAFILLAFVLVGEIVSQAMLRSGIIQPDADKSSSPQVAQPVESPKVPAAKKDPHAETLGPVNNLTVNLIVELLTAGIAVGWVMYRVRATPRDLGFNLSQFGSDLRLGAAAFLASYLPVMGLQDLLEGLVPYEHPLIESLARRPDTLTVTLIGISALLAAPLFEELFFRVLIQGCFEAVEAKRRWLLTIHRSSAVSAAPSRSTDVSATPVRDGNLHRSSTGGVRPVATEAELVAASAPAMWPIVVTSTLFALMHMGQGAAPIPLFFFSLFLGFVYQRTHRIWPSVTAHFLLNGTTMAALWYNLMNPPNVVH